MTQRRQGSVVVVCPTEYGGQIEHAADTAIALAHATGAPSLLISRSGAAEYLGPVDRRLIEIAEIVPGRRPATTGVGRLTRPLQQVVDLVVEHLRIRRELRGFDHMTLVLDASRYPAPRLLSPKRRVRIVLFMHNANPHFEPSRASVRQRFLMALERLCVANADRIVTHGAPQLAIVRERFSTPAVSVRLPTTTFLTAPSQPESGSDNEQSLPTIFALCLGEIRHNKGVEVAIDAARGGGFELVLAGAPESAEYGADLRGRADAVANVTFIDRFLERAEFDRLLERASVVLLPYTRFDAQSGIVSKAVAAGKRMVASDLESLKDQLAGYGAAEFFEHGRADALRIAVLTALSGPKQAGPGAPRDAKPDTDWERVANAVLG